MQPLCQSVSFLGRLFEAWPDNSSPIEEIKRLYDHDAAVAQGISLTAAALDTVVPSAGFDPVYDEALLRIGQIKQSLEEHRLQEQDKLKCAAFLFVDSSSFASRTLARSHFNWKCRPASSLQTSMP